MPTKLLPATCGGETKGRSMTRSVSACRVACDSLVALGNATSDGTVHFAKNSDRPAQECQPLTLVEARTHAPGTSLRCTYIDIPQVSATARVLGSRPHWCWGFEHGLNEHGVAIGNHSVFTKDPVTGLGLIGMDLVRLGLERSHDAASALHVLTSLLEQYGQGGSGYGDKEWPYHNSFLIADRQTAFVLETSDRNWAARKVTGTASLTNHLTLNSDWDTLSADAAEHALRQGWWAEDSSQRFDFAAAYRDTSMAPESISSGRYARNCSWLAARQGKIDVSGLRLALRDHYGSPTPRSGLTPEDPEFFSVCMHADPVGTTTASLVTRLPGDRNEPLLYWASLGSPCVGIFLPLFVDCAVPSILQCGSDTPSHDSAWWRFKNLLTYVEADWENRFPAVRRKLDAFEATVEQQMRDEQMVLQTCVRRSSFCDEVLATALDTIAEFIRPQD